MAFPYPCETFLILIHLPTLHHWKLQRQAFYSTISRSTFILLNACTYYVNKNSCNVIAAVANCTDAFLLQSIRFGPERQQFQRKMEGSSEQKCLLEKCLPELGLLLD